MSAKTVLLLAIALTSLNAEPLSPSYSTFIGGSSSETPTALVTDSANNTYVAGTSNSFGWLANSPSDAAHMAESGYLIKFDARGNVLYSRRIPVTDPVVAVDASGAAYVAGHTRYPNLATPGAWQTTFKVRAVLVMKVMPDGSDAFSTYFGADGDASVKAIAVRDDGSPAICGTARKYLIPGSDWVPGGDPHFSEANAYCVMFSADVSRMLYATSLPGGQNETTPTAVRFDSTGALIIAGNTRVRQWPATSGALQANSRIVTAWKFDGASDRWQPVVFEGEAYILQFGKSGMLIPAPSSVGLSSLAVHPLDDTLACGATTSGGAMICSTDNFKSFASTGLFGVSRVIGDPDHAGRFFASVSGYNGGLFEVEFKSGAPTATPLWRNDRPQDLAMWHNAGKTILYITTPAGDLMRSTDGGSSFQKISGKISRIFTAPGSEDILYGLRLRTDATDSLLVRSDDGGSTWLELGSSFSQTVTDFSGALNAFVVDPRNSNVVYAATLDGAYRSVDGGLTFVPILDGLLNKRARDIRFDAAGELWIGAERGTDGFVHKIRTDDSKPVFSTLLGGSGGSEATGLNVTADGMIVITGTTITPDFPATAPIAGNAASVFGHKFVTELDDSGELKESGLFRAPVGSGAVAADAGCVFIAGAISEQRTNGVFTVARWVMYDRSTGERMSEGTQTGSYNQRFTAVATGPDQKLRLAGSTSSPDFPVTPDAWQPIFGGIAGTGDATFSIWDVAALPGTP